jgi:sulfite reductase (NADPH) hemoprotein beta-component
LEETLEELGLRHDAITIRMTGCPNGCGRPFISEIGLVGRGPGRYNVYLGGGHAGDRLSKLFREDVRGEEIAVVLEPVIRAYAQQRNDGERFGDFVIRAEFVNATVQGDDFHKNLGDVKAAEVVPTLA